MSSQPRSYKSSSSFQVTLFTYLLFCLLLCSCLLSLGLQFSDRQVTSLQPLLHAQTQRFVDSGCQPFKGIWLSNQSSVSEQIHIQRHPQSGQRYLTHHVQCGGNKYQLGVAIEAASPYPSIQTGLLIFDVAVILILMVVMYAIGRFVVKGTNKISSTAQRIMATGDLSQRIDIDNRWDDLSYSAATINELLTRIEELMQGVKRVSDSIAHDLRTPLTRLRNDIEDVRSKSADTEAFEPLVKEVDQLIRTFNSLLRISRIETEQRRSHFSSLNVKTLLQDVAQFYFPLFEDKGIQFDEHLVEVEIYADKDLMFQAIANVLDNALKFTPAGGQIQLRSQLSGDYCVITVSDTGGGIDAEHIDKVMQRFYRADASRNPEGTGLGLALVGAVIQLHKGDVALHNDNLGLRVTIKLPRLRRRAVSDLAGE